MSAGKGFGSQNIPSMSKPLEARPFVKKHCLSIVFIIGTPVAKTLPLWHPWLSFAQAPVLGIPDLPPSSWAFFFPCRDNINLVIVLPALLGPRGSSEIDLAQKLGSTSHTYSVGCLFLWAYLTGLPTFSFYTDIFI